MELDLQKNEPIHGALARYATDHGKSPLRLIQRLLPSTNSNAIAFVLPQHLQLLIDHLPPMLGLTPLQLAAQHTFFPAVAPFLESNEAELLLQRMTNGGSAPAYPICHAMGDHRPPVIRYCPACAAEDRSSTCGVARWRIIHQLYGIVACAKHKCHLINTSCGFGSQRIFHDAEIVIPSSLPEVELAHPNDIQMAEDLVVLFSPSCSRPGRKRIRAMLRRMVSESPLLQATTVRLKEERLYNGLVEFYGAKWLQRFNSNPKACTNNLLGGQLKIRPAIFNALLGRFFGLSLSEFLATATSAEPIDSPQEQNSKEQRVYSRIWKPSSQTIEANRQRIVELLRRSPNATRKEVRSAAAYSVNLLFRSDRKWIKAILPARKPRQRLNWHALDAQKSAMVHNAAKELQSSPGRPKRITIEVLRLATVGCRWRGPKYKKKLPLLYGALKEEVETPHAYTERIMRWLCREVAMGRRRPFASVNEFLSHAKLSMNPGNHPELRVRARELLAASPTDKSSFINSAIKASAA